MSRFIIIVLLLLPAAGFSQTYIDKTRSEVKEELGKYPVAKDGATKNITETDSSLTMSVKGRGVIAADYIYSFGRSGRCNTEKTVTWSDSSHQKLLQAVLDHKDYGWKLINFNQYVSKFSAGLFIETQAANNVYSFTILKTNLDKKSYELLMKNK